MTARIESCAGAGVRAAEESLVNRLQGGIMSCDRRHPAKSSARSAYLESLEHRVLLSDVQVGLLIKSVNELQSGQYMPGLNGSMAYHFDAVVNETSPGSVSGASFAETSPMAGAPVTIPEAPLSNPIPEYDFVFKGDEPSAVNAEVPDGATYALSMTGVNDGNHTFNLSFPSTDNFPDTIPEVNNYAGLQAVDPTQPLDLSWNAFHDGSASDFVAVFITNSGTGAKVFESYPGTSNVLSGLANDVVIPAGDLSPGTTYNAQVQFLKVVDSDTTDYPGVAAYAVYAVKTVFSIVTTGAASTSPAQVAFAQQPAAANINASITPAVTVDVEDSSGDLVAADNSTVTLSVASGSPTTALTGTTSVAAVNGVATFADLQFTSTGTFSLLATDGSLVWAQSSAFIISSPASSFATLSAGALTVTGTSGDDVIALASDGANVTATLNGTPSQTFALSSITSIVVNGNAGNDSITIESSMPASLGVSVQGGPGDDTIQGGPGNDTLGGGVGNDFILGGPGDDLIHGGAGDDSIGGGQGNDILYGGLGNDTITGGAGNDTITGGAGGNVLHGGLGDDVLFAVNGSPDTLYGGAGNDTAHVDKNLDLIPNLDIETLLFS
jgi:hypothetical protein